METVTKTEDKIHPCSYHPTQLNCVVYSLPGFVEKKMYYLLHYKNKNVDTLLYPAFSLTVIIDVSPYYYIVLLIIALNRSIMFLLVDNSMMYLIRWTFMSFLDYHHHYTAASISVLMI